MLRHKPASKSANRRQVLFTTTLAIIGLIFVVSVIAILTGKRLIPSASDVGGTRDTSPLVIRDGKVDYQAPGGQKGTAGVNQVTVERLASQVTVKFSLQGRSDLSTAPTFNVRVIAANKDTHVKIAEVQLTSSRADTLTDKSQRQLVINDPTFLTNLSGYNGPVILNIKVDNYLGKNIIRDNVNLLYDTTLDFSAQKTGDFNGDNVIDELDFAQFGPEVHKPVTDANARFDVNGDNAIDDVDFAIWAGEDNFGKQGESF